MGSLSYATLHVKPPTYPPKFLDNLWASCSSLLPPHKLQRRNCCHCASWHSGILKIIVSFLSPPCYFCRGSSSPCSGPCQVLSGTSQPSMVLSQENAINWKPGCGCTSRHHLLEWFLARMTAPSSPQFKSGCVYPGPLCLRSISVALQWLCLNTVWSFIGSLLWSHVFTEDWYHRSGFEPLPQINTTSNSNMQNRSEVCSLTPTLRTLRVLCIKRKHRAMRRSGVHKQKVGVHCLMLNLAVEKAQLILCNTSSGQALKLVNTCIQLWRLMRHL